MSALNSMIAATLLAGLDELEERNRQDEVMGFRTPEEAAAVEAEIAESRRWVEAGEDELYNELSTLTGAQGG